MEAAVVEPRPRIRAAVRDRLNRFLQIHAMRTDKTKAPLQLVRLAAISRAQLASVRRHVAELKFALWPTGWAWFMPDVGCGATAGRIDVSAKEMSAIAQLLRRPIRLLLVDARGLEHVDWAETTNVVEFVNGLDVYELEDPHKFPVLAALIDRVTPQLRNLKCSTDVLNRLPPLELDKLELLGTGGLHDALKRHTIRRLDMNTAVISEESPSEQLSSPSIKSLGLVEDASLFSVRPESVVAFCRRFPGLEALHLVVEQFEFSDEEEDPFFKRLWDDILWLREHLNVPGLQRLFFDVEYLGVFHDDKLERMQKVEPFDKATFSVCPLDDDCVRMFFKMSWPTEQLPTFFRIRGEFFWDEEYVVDEEEILL
ncbi:hypothetical protein M3Y99_01971500 [Aphelenchoides fujianensis]|nr:hypothetical protein M3Y99_01971500 [Aphelenchoides fujianensis]